ncbi:DnaJ-domain-containing protein [Scenedesmus sp. NREL 46B-D3]|nr:DnaJ-domain-containing protein [Scenedesmus sp. NREL 46B-D3]
MLQQGLIEAPAEPSSSDEDDSGDASSAAGGSTVHASGSVGSNLDDMQPPPGVSWKKSKAKKKQTKGKDTDYYALLGLQHERFMATEAQLKQAYRKACLEHHPDKKLVGVDCEDAKFAAEEHFKKIQEAYDVLSDPAKRREFDSVDEFDDSLPWTAHQPTSSRRNARWSVDPKVPDVGDESSSWEAVSAFYDFWYGFKSWREFPHPDEEDVEGAESREHKRWIERINAKLREKGKKEEGRRLREFVDASYRVDPRVIARKEAQAAERERRKAEKAEAKRLQEEQQQRQKEEEEARKRAEEAAAKAAAAEAKKVRDAEKQAMKKERQRLRKLADAGEGQQRLLSIDDTERLCQSLNLQQMQRLGEAASAAGTDAAGRAALLQEALQQLEQREEEQVALKDAKKQEAEAALKNLAKRDHAKKMQEMREWGDDELRMLDKAVKKFPWARPSAGSRCAAAAAAGCGLLHSRSVLRSVPAVMQCQACLVDVAMYVRTRTLEEVLLMVKEHQGASSTRMQKQEDWKGAAKKRADVTSEADSRSAAFTDVNVNITGEAAAVLVPGAADSSGSTPSSSRGNSRPSSATAAAAVGVKKVVSADSGEWNEEQELALVQALKQFGKELPDRWERIAGVVPGKGKAACFKRFKELRDVFRAKKDGA